MSVRPVDFGILQRMNEVAQIKQNEITKPLVEQVNLHNQFTKEIYSKSEHVQKKDNLENNNDKKFDAKDKGSNSYFKSNSNTKEKKEEVTDGKVIIKNQKGFDITV